MLVTVQNRGEEAYFDFSPERLVAVVERGMQTEHGGVADALDQEGVVVPVYGGGVTGEECRIGFIGIEREVPVGDVSRDCVNDLLVAGWGNGDGVSRHGRCPLREFALRLLVR